MVRTVEALARLRRKSRILTGQNQPIPAQLAWIDPSEGIKTFEYGHKAYCIDLKQDLY
jgi:hypothetical protein